MGGDDLNKLTLLPFILLLVSACGSAPTPVIVTSQVTRQVEVTRLATIEVTKIATVEVTKLATVEVTQIVVVTATYSGPSATPTITPTPAPSLTPSPTIDYTKADKRDGSYMVGSEISPGIWRSSGGSPDENCWLSIKDFGGDLVDITGELPGATIRIPNGEYMVYIGGGSGNKCVWSFLKP
jgi:hypothetical protein